MSSKPGSRKSVAKPKRSVSAARHVADFVVLAVTIAAAWFLWPASLGGSSRMITVEGHSMEPTYHTGDLVLVDTSAKPEIGRIIIFRIAKGQLGEGQFVVHRLTGVRPDGTYITQGDNNKTEDAFLTSRSDILGSPRFSIPHGGEVIGMLSTPMGLAGAIGGLTTALMWPRKKPAAASENVEESAEQVSPEPTAAVVVAASMRQVEDPDVAAEAEAWLRDQLDLLTQV